MEQTQPLIDLLLLVLAILWKGLLESRLSAVSGSAATRASGASNGNMASGKSSASFRPDAFAVPDGVLSVAAGFGAAGDMDAAGLP